MFKVIKRNISVVLLSLVLGTGAKEWSHYQVILDKNPFGAQVDSTNATPDFARSLRLSALWQVRGQMRAGFEDVATKRDFVLGGGERTNFGLELIEIRYMESAVVLRQGNAVAFLRLQANAATPAPVGASIPTTANPWRAIQEDFHQHHPADGTNNQPPRIAYSGEQLERHLQEQQLQAIRIGAPPLPVALTQESVNQLTCEGFQISPAR